MPMIRRNKPAPVVSPGIPLPTPPMSDLEGPPNSPERTLLATPVRPITAIANQANACLGLVGITGSGKTSLAKTAVEEAWEVYHRRTQWYASDLGGYGNALLSLIRLGICRVWYIRNHINPFTTMELASQGCWPEMMLDLETGLAAPDVRLVPPRRVRWQVVCANNHPVATFDDQAQATAMQQACPTCGLITNVTNALRMDRIVVRSAGFRSIGHYVYDSMTQMSEYGLQMLREKSAKGELPAGGHGGAALGSADALREDITGGMVFGTGSLAQYGFMQDRVPVWLSNIRGIPDQVLPPTLTFGVERSKGDDESGGLVIYGPKIAGNARTSFVPGWLGNCLYTAKEAHNPPEVDEHGNVKTYHRLWLVNHVAPRDDTPIVAKHRGEPLGMPDYLEDSGKPEEAWKVCSLRVFYELLRKQADAIEQRDRLRFADAPALTDQLDEPEEVLEVTAASEASGPAPSATRIVRRSRRPGAAAVMPEVPPLVPPAPAAEGQDATAVGVAATLVAPAGTTVVEQAADEAGAGVVPPSETASPSPTLPAAPSVVVQQLEASLAAAEAAATGVPDAGTGGNGGLGTTATPPTAAPAAPAAAGQSSAAPPRAPGAVNRIRRVPRPPAE